MNAAQQLLLSMARDNARLALDQLSSATPQIALAMSSLKNAQMNLEHWQAASGQGASRKAIGNQPNTTTIDV